MEPARFLSAAPNSADALIWHVLGFVGHGFGIDVDTPPAGQRSLTAALRQRGWHVLDRLPGDPWLGDPWPNKRGPSLHFLHLGSFEIASQYLTTWQDRAMRPWLILIAGTDWGDPWLPPPIIERLSRAGYTRGYFDGQRHYWLAREKDALAATLAAPPQFSTACPRLEQQQMAECLAATEVARLAAQNQISALRAELTALTASRSWQLTRPVRWLLKSSHRLLSPPPPADPIAPPSTPPVPLQPLQHNIRLEPGLRHDGDTQAGSPSAPPTAGHALHYRLVGHAEGHYSLAVVNRGILKALAATHPGKVSLRPWSGDPVSLSLNAPAWMQTLAATPDPAPEQICSLVHHYPPIADPQPSALRLMLFFWEETEVPAAIVAHLQSQTDAILVASRFVQCALRNSGCAQPIAVIPLGIDHLIPFPLPPLTSPQPPAGQPLRFLHVSSVFKRKGPDILLAAWRAAFTAADNVELFIKTFPNPHNRIRDQWAEIISTSSAHPAPAPVIIDETPLDDDGMLALYRSAHALVLPTRGEGFNLPAAEALALGIPLIVTGQGGHADFCTPATAALLPYHYAPSRSHLSSGEACWLEPDLQSLIDQLRHLRAEILAPPPSPAALALRRSAGQAQVSATYTWANSASALDRITAYLAADPYWRTPATIKLHVLTPWATACGIAEYSRSLLSEFKPATWYIDIRCDHRTPDPGVHEQEGAITYQPTWQIGDSDSVARALDDMARRARPGDVALIQHQPSLYPLDTAVCAALLALHQAGCVVLLQLHATRTLLDHHRPPPAALNALRQLDRILIHHVADRNQLLALGLDDNLIQMPLGVDAAVIDSMPSGRIVSGLPENALILASFGFLLPHKGIGQLVFAVAQLQAQLRRPVHLLAVNALPDPANTALLDQYRELAVRQGVADQIQWHTDFNDIVASLALLAQADYILFPYAATQESASGAVTIGLASRRPVLVSNQPIFADLSACTWRMAGGEAADIAAAVAHLQSHPDARAGLQAAQATWLAQRSWHTLSTRLAQTLRGCRLDRWLADKSHAVTPTVTPLPARPRLLIDVSRLMADPAAPPGTLRPLRLLLQQLQQPPPAGWVVCPVILDDNSNPPGYRHVSALDSDTTLVFPQPNDVFLGLAPMPSVQTEAALHLLRIHGVSLSFLINDPQVFTHPDWLAAVARQGPRLLSFTAAMGAELRHWLLAHCPQQVLPPISPLPLAALLRTAVAPQASAPMQPLPAGGFFLTVGDIAPASGHAGLLAAFEHHWARGEHLAWVIAGPIADGAEADMVDFSNYLRQHPEQGLRLLWLDQINEAGLASLYQQARALILANETPGNELPILEAARAGCPLILRNTPAFRETAGSEAFYFDANQITGLTQALQQWRNLIEKNQHPQTLAPSGSSDHQIDAVLEILRGTTSS